MLRAWSREYFAGIVLNELSEARGGCRWRTAGADRRARTMVMLIEVGHAAKVVGRRYSSGRAGCADRVFELAQAAAEAVAARRRSPGREDEHRELVHARVDGRHLLGESGARMSILDLGREAGADLACLHGWLGAYTRPHLTAYESRPWATTSPDLEPRRRNGWPPVRLHRGPARAPRLYYFLDIRRSNLQRITRQGAELVRADTGEGNGTTFDCRAGSSSARRYRRSSRWSRTAGASVLMDRHQGKRLNVPRRRVQVPTAASGSPIRAARAVRRTRAVEPLSTASAPDGATRWFGL